VKSRPFLHLGRWLVVLVFLTTLCVASIATREISPSPSGAPDITVPSVVSINPSIPAAATPAFSTVPTTSDTVLPPTTSTASPDVNRDLLAGITMTSVPRNVIVPTNADSLDEVTNPINGRRGGSRAVPEDLDCVAGATGACLTDTLDMLGFDVTSGSREDRERRVQRATAVVQLDAGLPMTGVPDADLLQYLGIAADTTRDADEERQIGTSATGRPIMAMRYGDGPRTVLVVGQTHGDEEGGLRVLLRVRSLSLPEEITLWVIPTMNPDGLALDTRFLANGADPNREAPSQLEQQAVYDFALSTRPSLTVWYHQNYGWVGASGASTSPATRYHSMTGLGTLNRSGDCAKGFMWCPIDELLGSSSILVELPDVVTPADVRIHALALLAVASDDAP
jgi:Zinc carboxypeptidase